MSPGDLLGLTAQIAVALAGFTGVVATFGRGGVHRWTRVERYRLVLMLIFSVLPLGLCLIGLLLLATPLATVTVWQCCSVLAFAFLGISAFALVQEYARFEAGEFKSGGGSMAVFYAVGGFGAGFMVLQIYNLLAPGAFWPFYGAVVTQLLASTLQFTRLILARRDEGA
jgi:hypothetical protein